MHGLVDSAQVFLNYLNSSLWATSATVFICTILILWVKNWLTYQPPVVVTYQPVMCGDITLESLRKFDGRDFLKPLYFAVRGKVFDVSTGKDFYGPGQLKQVLRLITKSLCRSCLYLCRCWVSRLRRQRVQQSFSKDVSQ